MVWSALKRLLLPFALLLCGGGLDLAAKTPARRTGPGVPADGGPTLASKAVLVLHNATGKVLLARNASQVRPVASLTKLVAALVVRAKGLKLEQGTVINREDWKVARDGARTRLELKWTYRNRDLLHAALMSSDNRATSALGRAVGLNATALVQAMNDHVQKMGLSKTSFRGPVGIDPRNQSTAHEMGRIVRRASKDQVLREIMSKKAYQLKPMRGYLAVHYRNTNALVGSTPLAKFIASKTGFNSEAGYCLASVAEVKGLGPVTIVLLGAKRKFDRPVDLRRVLRWLVDQGKSRLTFDDKVSADRGFAASGATRSDPNAAT
jgi:D-alanyl-D-alanine endopeptidase (penicillin-binding protein 7)